MENIIPTHTYFMLFTFFAALAKKKHRMSPTAEKTEEAAPEATEETKKGRGRPKSTTTKRPAEKV